MTCSYKMQLTCVFRSDRSLEGVVHDLLVGKSEFTKLKCLCKNNTVTCAMLYFIMMEVLGFNLQWPQLFTKPLGKQPVMNK